MYGSIPKIYFDGTHVMHAFLDNPAFFLLSQHSFRQKMIKKKYEILSIWDVTGSSCVFIRISRLVDFPA